MLSRGYFKSSKDKIFCTLISNTNQAGHFYYLIELKYRTRESMNSFKIHLIVSLLFLTGYSANYCQAQKNKQDLLVSTDWLEENLSDSLMVLLHYGMKTEFEQGHIPGARLISIWDILIENEDGLRHELPAREKLEQVLRSWGINNTSRIIITFQDGNGLPMAARLYFTLDYAGLGKKVSLLNGGFQAWQDENRPASKERDSIKEGNIEILTAEKVRISKEEILASLTDENVVVIDARPSDRYYGTGEDNNSSRQGHIQGAVNIPFFEVRREDSSNMFKSMEELRLLFEKKGIKEGNKIITYCGTGIWASPLYFTAKILGYPVRFYDGSFQEWGNDESLPVERLE